jgi:hypothetical protein
MSNLRKTGYNNKTAGLNFLKYVKSQDCELPMLLQSSDKRNAAKAKNLNIGFIDKNSENLSNELMNFIIDNIGFGDFVFSRRKQQTHCRSPQPSRV